MSRREEREKEKITPSTMATTFCLHTAKGSACTPLGPKLKGAGGDEQIPEGHKPWPDGVREGHSEGSKPVPDGDSLKSKRKEAMTVIGLCRG